MIPWIVEYAATIINKGQVGADGKTAYERLNGKPAHLSGPEFGEKVLWKAPLTQGKERIKWIPTGATVHFWDKEPFPGSMWLELLPESVVHVPSKEA